jgi:lipopolysaccharide transport system permease protein
LPELPRTVIHPSHGWIRLDLAELWRYRELLFFLLWRDIKFRYKQTALGAIWAILQPLLSLIVFAIFFGHLAKIPSDGVPYPLFTYTALVPWQLFAYALAESGSSVVLNERLITKIYFPRLVIPLASVLAGLVDFAIALPLIAGMMAWYHRTPSWAALTLPLFVVLALATAWALDYGLRHSRFNIVTCVIRSPLSCSSGFLPLRWPTQARSFLRVGVPWHGLNPMAGVFQGFRWALLGGPAPGFRLTISIAVVAVVLIGGLYYYRRMEKTFADVV